MPACESGRFGHILENDRTGLDDSSGSDRTMLLSKTAFCSPVLAIPLCALSGFCLRSAARSRSWFAGGRELLRLQAGETVKTKIKRKAIILLFQRCTPVYRRRAVLCTDVWYTTS